VSDETPPPTPAPESVDERDRSLSTHEVVKSILEDDDAIIAEVLDGDDSGPVSRGDLKQVVTLMSHHRGPLPHPDSLARYDAIIPNGAERIMRMAELEQQHRHKWESGQQTLVESIANDEARIAGRGQVLAACLCVLLIVAGLVFMWQGYPKLGASIILTDLVALATVFLKAGARPETRETNAEMPPLDETQRSDAGQEPPHLPRQ